MAKKNFQELTDIQLLSLIKEGNQLAFYHLYNKYWRELYSRTINVLRDKGKTEDVLHEVFTSIWMRRSAIQIENLRSYLFTAVRNNAFEKINTEKYVDLGEELISTLSLPADVDEYFNAKALEKDIENAVKDLPVRRRAIFYMSRYQEYSISEIAHHFGISHRTVENQLHLALKHLRNTLGITLTVFLLIWIFKT